MVLCQRDVWQAQNWHGIWRLAWRERKKIGALFPQSSGNRAQEWSKTSNLRAVPVAMLTRHDPLASHHRQWSVSTSKYFPTWTNCAIPRSCGPSAEATYYKTRVTTLEMSKSGSLVYRGERQQWKTNTYSKGSKYQNKISDIHEIWMVKRSSSFYYLSLWIKIMQLL